MKTNRTKTSLRFGLTLAAALVLVAATWIASELRARAGGPEPFPHAVHIEEGAGCTDCHEAGEEDFALPTVNRGACEDCHEDDIPEFAAQRTHRRAKLRFPHTLHTDVGECTDCHGAVAKGEKAAGTPHVAPAKCFECHAENDVETPESRCAACHGKDQRRVEPEDHHQGWELRHGVEQQRRNLAGHGRDCALCHTRGECKTCHMTTRPQSHTGLWRQRTHGRAAAWERDACRTCHETGACIACHRSTPPLSHRGAWERIHGLSAGSRADERCVVCHRPAECKACHDGR